MTATVNKWKSIYMSQLLISTMQSWILTAKHLYQLSHLSRQVFPRFLVSLIFDLSPIFFSLIFAIIVLRVFSLSFLGMLGDCQCLVNVAKLQPRFSSLNLIYHARLNEFLKWMLKPLHFSIWMQFSVCIVQYSCPLSVMQCFHDHLVKISPQSLL